MQPDIYTSNKALTDEEKRILESLNHRYPGSVKTVSRYRADLLQARKSLAAKGVRVVDLKDVLDSVNEPVFIDPAHVVDAAYTAMAKRLLPIFERLGGRRGHREVAAVRD